MGFSVPVDTGRTYNDRALEARSLDDDLCQLFYADFILLIHYVIQICTEPTTLVHEGGLPDKIMGSISSYSRNVHRTSLAKS